jgi:hypothetical protein
MSDATPGQSATLVPLFDRVTIGDETYTIGTFSLARTIRAFALLTQLAEIAGLGKERDEQQPSSVFGGIISALPTLVKTGTPALYSLLGLIITPNVRLRKMEEDGEDVDEYLLRQGRRLSHEANTQQFVQLLTAAVKAIGVDTVLGEVSGLLAAVKS